MNHALPDWLLPGDLPFVDPVAEILGEILEPAPGHDALLCDVFKVVKHRMGPDGVPFGVVKRIIRSSGVRVCRSDDPNVNPDRQFALGVRLLASVPLETGPLKDLLSQRIDQALNCGP
ncbi:hypothetical protein ACFQ7F_31090 [Streptomyces sp. NPDC056486]|uniref:hypothetical protein n=1 Tax=Streptomyces sp. NPDC056486 TaxID=3345835 RepID=UPI0036CC2D4F